MPGTIGVYGNDGRGYGARIRCALPKENVERQWKLNLLMLVRTVVISTGMPVAAYQEDIPRVSLEFEVPRVARSTCRILPQLTFPRVGSTSTCIQSSPAAVVYWSSIISFLFVSMVAGS